MKQRWAIGLGLRQGLDQVLEHGRKGPVKPTVLVLGKKQGALGFSFGADAIKRFGGIGMDQVEKDRWGGFEGEHIGMEDTLYVLGIEESGKKQEGEGALVTVKAPNAGAAAAVAADQMR